MIVSPKEYNSLVHRLVDPNEFMDMIRIPADEPIYNIDLTQRLISAPDFLSVEEDHNSEIIWFQIERFFDNIDLYGSTCWIQYINASGEQYFYAAPLIIGVEQYGSEKILIPWAISKEVAKTSGIVEFSFQFFKLSEDGLHFHYVLNTQSAKSKILAGLRVDPTGFLTDAGVTDEQVTPQREWLATELAQLTEKYNKLSKDYELYWTVLK